MNKKSETRKNIATGLSKAAVLALTAFTIALFFVAASSPNKNLSLIKDDFCPLERFLNTLSTSTCSHSSNDKGQKVIAFTYYEGRTFDKYSRNYFDGVLLNVNASKFVYGDEFRVRIYFRISKESPNRQELCSLAERHAHLDLCDVEATPRFGDVSAAYPLIWRFLPVMDKEVDLALSRDLDSVLNDREAAAVKEFVSNGNSEVIVHVMRDHPQHGIGMLGGTWAGKLDNHRELWRKSALNMLTDKKANSPGSIAGVDQDLLHRHVYKWSRKGKMMSHDSYTCSKFSWSRPFPTRRRDEVGNFVGAPVVTLQNRIPFDKEYECPKACRFKPNWTYC